MNFDKISRRRVLQGTAALTLGTALPLRPALAADTTIGFIYVGSRDDYGYNQAHAARRRRAQEDGRRQGGRGREGPGDRCGREDHGVHDQSRRRDAPVPDLVRLLQPAHDQDRRQISEAALRALRRPVDRQGSEERRQLFRLYRRGRSTSAASSPATSTKSGKLGFVAAKPIPQVLRNINAFTIGAKLANPKVTTQVIFTGDWSMPVKEAEATNSLIDQGVDVITCHVDGPKTVVENAARRGAMVCGYHVNQAVLAPQGLSHRRRVELGSALSALRQDVHRGRDHPEFLSRRPQGRASSRSRPTARWCGRGAQASRRGQGER